MKHKIYFADDVPQEERTKVLEQYKTDPEYRAILDALARPQARQLLEIICRIPDNRLPNAIEAVRGIVEDTEEVRTFLKQQQVKAPI